jgi:glutathione S-transferase
MTWLASPLRRAARRSRDAGDPVGHRPIGAADSASREPTATGDTIIIAQERWVTVPHRRALREAAKSTHDPTDAGRDAGGSNRPRGRRASVKLYDGDAPDPRRVRIFLAEKGVEVPVEPAVPRELEERSAPFAAANSLERVPALVLDDGTRITEAIAICRYFEALRPNPPLFGRGAREIALVEMWNRRVELNVYGTVTALDGSFNPAVSAVEQEIPDWRKLGDQNMLEFLDSLDRELKDRLFIAGDHYSVADVTGLVSIDLIKSAMLAVPVEFANIHRWHAQVAARASAAA